MRAPPILRYALPMPTVTLTRHLHAFFPTLAGEELRVDAATVAEVVQAIERSAPGFAFYTATRHMTPRIVAALLGSNLATIGRMAAVVDVRGVRLSGIVAWWFWLVAHVFFLIGFRNRPDRAYQLGLVLLELPTPRADHLRSARQRRAARLDARAAVTAAIGTSSRPGNTALTRMHLLHGSHPRARAAVRA
jgi:hypothetical protein